MTSRIDAKNEPARPAGTSEKAALCRLAEQRVRPEVLQEVENLSPDEVQRLFQDLLVHQYELEMQNDELRRAQLEIETARQRYFELYDLAPVGYCSVDGSGVINEANLTLGRMLGLDRSALLRRRISQFIKGEDYGRYYALVKNLSKDLSRSLTANPANQSGSGQCEARMHRSDGTSFWAKLEAVAVTNDDVQPGFRVVISDISASKRMSEEILEREEFFRMSFEEHGAIKLHIDPVDGRIVRCNKAAAAFYGLPAQILMERRIQDFCADGPEAAERELEKAWNQNNMVLFFRQLVKDHVDHDVRLYCSRIVFRGKELLHCIAHDVTEQLRAKQALLESEGLYRALSEDMPMMVCRFTLDLRLTYVNTTYCDFFGKTPEDLVGSSFLDLIPGKEHDAARQVIASMTPEAPTIVHEHQVFDGSGGLRWLRWTNRNLINEQGIVTAYQSVGEDITERKRAEEKLAEFARMLKEQNRELEQARARAEQATQAKGEFLANMSHEIRTPMNAVIGVTDLLLDTEMAPEQHRFAQTIQSSAQALLSLLNDILDFSKIEAGKLELEELEFDLVSLLDDLTTSMALLAHQKGLELISFPDLDTPRLLRGDPGRLRQVLTNLVGNAVKFTQQGEVVVRIEEVHGSRFSGSTVEETEDGGVGIGAKNLSPDGVTPNATYSHATTAPTVNREPLNLEPLTVKLRFTVRDTGIGIPQDKIDLLFDKFTQVDASTTRKFGGTGLGLAICRQLVEMMGGEIGVRSQEGQGSEFWFTVRLAPAEARVRTIEPPRQLDPVTTLVVDDNVTNREILSRMLAKWGLPVLSAPSGSQALKILNSAHAQGALPGRIVMDMQMPGMDGAQLGRAIQADPRFRDIALIMLSTVGEVGDARRFADMGFAAYLNKPVRSLELFDVLAMLQASGNKTATGPIITRHSAREAMHPHEALPRLRGRVLLAEDNQVNQLVALGILRKLGLTDVLTTEDGSQAVDRLKQGDVDVVLMDVQMPIMDGLEAAREIRIWEATQRAQAENASRSRTPIIAMTAGAMAQDRARCIAADMDDYVTKPVNPWELAKALSKWLPQSDDDALARGRSKRDLQEPDRPTTKDQPRQDHVAAKPTQPDLPVMNREDQLARFMGDVELVDEALRVFLQTLPERINALRQAVAAKDLQAAGLVAHTLRGTALNLSCAALAHEAKTLEQACHDHHPDLQESMHRVEREAERLRLFVEESLRPASS
ncbi:PAS domain S-box-containing protein [Desulfonatronum zhilinae]|nr:PAS domain S-box-containing protein [Desulfonatronum zhilinae]